MARLAEVRVAPAEPLRDGAAEFAFEIDKVRAVLLAFAITKAEKLRGTFTADKILGLELLRGLLCSDAIFHSAKVSVLALKALIVGEFEQCPRLQIVVVDIFWILEARLFVDTFVLSTLKRHIVHFLLHIEELL